MTFPNHLDNFENHKREFRENMQTIYQKTLFSLYKIATLAELKIRNTYYIHQKAAFKYQNSTKLSSFRITTLLLTDHPKPL
jgi:hypothetical protein